MEKYQLLKSLGDGKYYPLEEAISKPNIRYRVGCDSLNVKQYSVYIMSLVGIYPENTGAFVYYFKEKIPKIKNIQERLWKEVEMSVAFAKFLRDEHGVNIESVDFDLNIIPEYPSSRLAPSAMGYASAEGFKSCCKPEKLYAIWSSDHVVHNAQKKVFRPHHKKKKVRV